VDLASLSDFLPVIPSCYIFGIPLRIACSGASVTRWTPRTVLAAALLALGPVGPASGQTADPRSSVVIVTGQQATMPIPTLMEGAQSTTGNFEVADQLFLRLAGLGPTLTTAGDRGFEPLLARSWTRRDSVTLAFDLDPRARWHDGAPVTSRDVVFTFQRARDAAIAPKLAVLLRRVASVTAEGDGRLVFRFTQPYAEQLYDATFHVAPLPAHLLAALPATELARSPFVDHPVGSGPYRWVRSEPGQFVELAAVEDFFLGRPGIDRVIVRSASDPEARLNLLLSGQADAMDNVPPPLSNLQRVAAHPDVRLVRVPSPTVGYLLFNQRDPANPSRPHPILGDPEVRRALVLALDRRTIVRAVLGDHGEVPYGPVSPLLWIRHGAGEPVPRNLARARRLLATQGWRDHDGDGLLDRDGIRLALMLNLPNSSGIRRQMALLVQEQLRHLGVAVELRQFEFPVYSQRRSAGAFDLDFSAASQDPSPSGLTQSWACDGGSNVAHYCSPRVDSLFQLAMEGQGDVAGTWHAALRQIEEDAPAVFLYAPTYVYAVNRRFTNVTIRPESAWLALWRWSVTPRGGGASK
jgi:peptide/nickel transport system substrate-binding protein